jgi:hypothetical protein
MKHPWNTSTRLNFEYHDRDIELVSWNRLKKISPPSDPMANYEDESGWWVILTDERGNVVYRQIIHNPIRIDKELFSYGRKGGVSWEIPDAAEQNGEFSVLVPDIPTATHLSLYGSFEEDEVSVPSWEILTLELGLEDLELDIETLAAPRDLEEGRLVGITKLVDNGSSTEQWNIVLLSEGYRESEIPDFHQHSEGFVSKLKATRPFTELWDLINVYLVNVASIDSGISDPKNPQDNPRTYFDARFYNFALNDRLIVANQDLALLVVRQNVPDYNVAMMIVNTKLYGGSGGTVAVFSAHPQSAKIGIHEMGHSAFGLADEYEYAGSNGLIGNHYSGQPRSESNIATSIERAKLKWGHLIDQELEIPFFRNPNCNDFSPNPPPHLTGKVGAFEGAFHHHCGVYRPEAFCIMRSLGHKSFCKVCADRIRRIISSNV